MKMTFGNGCGALSCELELSKDLKIYQGSHTEPVESLRDEGGEELCAEAVRYAVCRFLRRSREAAALYVPMSYRLRLKSGRNRSPRLCRFRVRAQALELPGHGFVRVGLRVSAEGVTVEWVQLPPLPPLGDQQD